METVQKAIEVLRASKARLESRLVEILKKNRFNYRSFGTEIESYVVDELVNIFKDSRVIKTNEDCHKAKDKNEFPDFTLLSSNPALAVEIKTGSHTKLQEGKWVQTKNSNNDLGTLNEWGEKIKKFGVDYIYFLFIEYIADERSVSLINIKIAPFYRFVGLNEEGFLRYREKDGNLRPKDFEENPPIQSAEEFIKLLEPTKQYRSERIIKKHWEKLPVKRRKKLRRDLDS